MFKYVNGIQSDNIIREKGIQTPYNISQKLSVSTQNQVEATQHNSDDKISKCFIQHA